MILVLCSSAKGAGTKYVQVVNAHVVHGLKLLAGDLSGLLEQSGRLKGNESYR